MGRSRALVTIVRNDKKRLRIGSIDVEKDKRNTDVWMVAVWAAASMDVGRLNQRPLLAS